MTARGRLVAALLLHLGLLRGTCTGRRTGWGSAGSGSARRGARRVRRPAAPRPTISSRPRRPRSRTLAGRIVEREVVAGLAVAAEVHGDDEVGVQRGDDPLVQVGLHRLAVAGLERRVEIELPRARAGDADTERQALLAGDLGEERHEHPGVAVAHQQDVLPRARDDGALADGRVVAVRVRRGSRRRARGPWEPGSAPGARRSRASATTRWPDPRAWG